MVAIGLRCPKCGGKELRVIDSRPSDKGSIRRRRKCGECGFKITTHELRIDVPPEKFSQIMAADSRLARLSYNDLKALNWLIKRFLIGTPDDFKPL